MGIRVCSRPTDPTLDVFLSSNDTDFLFTPFDFASSPRKNVPPEYTHNNGNYHQLS